MDYYDLVKKAMKAKRMPTPHIQAFVSELVLRHRMAEFIPAAILKIHPSVQPSVQSVQQ